MNRACSAALVAALALVAPPNVAAQPDPWVDGAARAARAVLSGADEARAWAGLAAALHAPHSSHLPAGVGTAGEIARAVADSVAAGVPALTDIVLSSGAAGTHITLLGAFDAAALRLTTDPRDAARLYIDLPGAVSALPIDAFPGISGGGIDRMLVLRRTDAVRIVITMIAGYTATLDEATAGSVLLRGAPVLVGSWHASSVRPLVTQRPAAAGPDNAQGADAVATRALDLAARAAAVTAAGGRQLSSAVRGAAQAAAPAMGAAMAHATRGAASARHHLIAPAFATPERAAASASALLGLLLAVTTIRSALHRRGLGSARTAGTPAGAAIARAPRPTPRAQAGATKQAARRLRSARSLIAAGHDPVDVARRTRLSRDAVRLLASATAHAG